MPCARCVKAREQARGTATQRGYGAEWRRIRDQVLAEEPVCTICRAAPSTDVDHIRPLRAGGTNARSNLRGTCHSCHSSKTVREDGGFGRTPRARRGR